MSYMTSVLFGADNSSPSTSATNYNRINASYPSSWSTSESLRSTVAPSAFSLSNFYMSLDVAPGSGKSYTFTVLKNGVATGLTVTLTGTNKTATDTTNTASFVAGDTLSLQCIPSGTPTTNNLQSWNFLVTSTDLNAPMFSSLGAQSSASTNYTGSTAGHISSTGWSATEADMQIIAPTSGSLSNLYVAANVAPGVSTSYQYTLIVNGTATNLDAMMSNAATTAVDTAHSVSINAGDSLTIRSIPTGTPTAPANISFGIVFTPTVPGESFFGFGSASIPSATGGQYESPTGIGNGSWVGAESSRTMILGPYTVTGMYVKIGTAAGVGASRTLTLHKQLSDTSIAVNLANTATTGHVTTSVAFTQGNVITIASSLAGTPAAATGGVHIGVLLYAAPVITAPIFTPIVMIY